MPRLALTLSALLLVQLLQGAYTYAQGPPSPVDLVLRDVHVVDVEAGRVHTDRDLFVDEGYVVAIEPTHPSGALSAEVVVEGAGRYVIPGLWDMHVHALSGEAQAANALPLFLIHGVTGIRDVGSFASRAEQESLLAAIDAGGLLGPRVVAAGAVVDGPPGAWPGMRLVGVPAEAAPVVAEIAREGWPAVKVYSLLRPESYTAVARAADSLGLPLYGHVPDALTVREAIAAGQRSIEHLGGKLLLGCSPEEAAVAASRAAALREVAETGDVEGFIQLMRAQADLAVETFDETLCERLAADLAAAGTYVTPTLVVADFYAGRDPAPDAPPMRSVPDEVRAQWAEADRRRAGFTDADRARTERAEAQGFVLIRHLRDAGVPLLAGTDAGWVNPYSFYGAGLHDELERLVTAGLTPAEALRAATLAPATFLDRADEFGAVAVGRAADLVVLNENPLAAIGHVRDIHAVVIGGTVLDRDALDVIHDEVVARASSQTGSAGSEQP